MSLEDAEKRLAEKVCRIHDFLTSLDKADQATFARWVKEVKPAGWIARIVTADGKRVNEKTLKRHLDGQCLCPPETPHKGAYRGA
jgi:hypothetical protein